MMKLIGTIVAMLVGLSLIGALGYGGYLTARELRTLFASLDPQVAGVTAFACVVVLVSAWLVGRRVAAANRQSRAVAFREEKAATYQLLLDYWTNRLGQPAPRSEELRAEFLGRLQVLDRLLALYGAAMVIKAHTALRESVRVGSNADPEVQARLREVLIAIRADLGSDTPAHIAGDLQRLLMPTRDEDARLRTALA
jgi:hypothetical protein